MDPHNVDDIIFSRPPVSVPQDPTPNESISFDPTPEDIKEVSKSSDAPKESLVDNVVPITDKVEQTDPYGTPIEPKKERVFTESEVQAMIRDRLSRGQYAQQSPPVAQSQQSPDNFEYNADSSEDWQTQLESFVEKTLSKREQKLAYQQQQHHDQVMQAQFEDKFNQGAARYQDFESVIIGKPLTPSMVVATRGMDDPAAFIYAAAKTQSGELERISKISDPLSQAIELGRLEERMRKVRSGVSSAPKPVNAITSDSISKSVGKVSIDERIRQDAEKYLRKR